MKTFIAFTLIIASISALPSRFKKGVILNNERFVTDAIASAIEDFSQSIKDAGLDPLYIQSDESSYALPVPVIFNAEGLIEEFLFHGLSEIVINNINYSIITSRVRFDITLPLIELSMEKANLETVLFGEQYNVATAGRLAIKNVNVRGEARVNIGVISGVSIRSININFKLGAVDSELSVIVAGYNLSNWLNTFCGVTIPRTFDEFENEINELIEIVALEVINANL